MFPFSRSFLRMNRLSDLLRRDLLSTLHRNQRTWEMLENDQLPRIDENTHYQMRVAVNDNGRMKVKTASKEPGKEWNVKVEEFLDGKKLSSIESGNKVEALEQGKSAEQKVEVDSQKDNMKETSQSTKATEEVKNEAVESVTENASKKDAVAEESKGKAVEQKQGQSQRNNELAYQRGSQLREIQSIFDSFERDFERSFNRDFGFFGPMYSSPFAEMDAMMESMQREMDYIFGRSQLMGFYDPFFRRALVDEAAVGSEEAAAKETKKVEPKKEQEETKSA